MIRKLNSLIFFGNERLSTGFKTTTPIIKGLIGSGYDVKMIVVNQSEKDSRPLEIARVASRHNIPLRSFSNLHKEANLLAKLRANIGVLVAYGNIVPKNVINLFPFGIVNVHPSLLPQYRGPSPIEQAILDGISVTGISIMQLTPTMDGGPIYAQKAVKIKDKVQKQILTEKISTESLKLLLSTLPEILCDKIRPFVQNEKKASYCPVITKKSGLIDWNSPADQIEREIRAYYGWPGSHTNLNGLNITVCQADVSRKSIKPPGKLVVLNKKLYVGCRTGSLRLARVKPAGKKIITDTDLINGYRKRLGF